MDSLTLARLISDIIVDKQGEDILVLDLQTATTITDYFVICTGNSSRQLDALEYAIREGLKQVEEKTIQPLSIEGQPDSGWILLDYGGVIAHLFDAETRAYYQLEDLWKTARIVAHIQ